MIDITDREFKLISDYIKENYGIHLKKEKKALVVSRLQSVLTANGFSNFTEYFDHILSDQTGESVVTLVNRITTNHTYFMREPDHFHYFREHVLPYLVRMVANKDLRIWCAACSSGEESYTLAMMIDEYFGNAGPGWDTRILATDISENVLETARKGVYGRDRLEALPVSWRRKYFRELDRERFVVVDSIRNQVIYRKFNLMEPYFPFRKKFHVIFCRNVMIYFDRATKTGLVKKLYDHMEYGGYLFIGHSESLDRETSPFRYVLPSIYRKE
jgi:chemotaxis protein methyltransferase CheR